MGGEGIPVAVVGVGHLGSRHARILASLEGVRLVGVADIEGERARRVADELGGDVAAETDFRRLVPRVRAACVTVPTTAHREVAVELLRGGIDVLVEKPVAATVAEAEEMLAAAAEADRILAVGHTERYNPAVEAVLATTRDPRFVEVHRLAPFSARSLDIDVVLDLMIHDLDVVATAVGAEVASIEAVGVPVLTDKVDICNARLRFANRAVANLTASRISRDRIRKLRIWERDRYISLDYWEQRAETYRLVAGPHPGAEARIERRALSVERREPLAVELEDFLDAVRRRRRPRVDGRAGLVALDLARRVLDAMES